MSRKATAYAPGLMVAARTRHRVRRALPIAGDVLVKVGDQVDAQQVVAQTFIPGDVTPVNIAKALSMQPGDVPATYAETSALRDLTGFAPSTPLRQGIARFIAWYREYYKV